MLIVVDTGLCHCHSLLESYSESHVCVVDSTMVHVSSFIGGGVAGARVWLGLWLAAVDK